MTWELKHSGYQVIALVAGQLRFSTKLAKRDRETAAVASMCDPLSTDYLLASVPVTAIRSVRVNNTRRSVRVITDDREVETIGFDSKTESLVRRLGGAEEHDPKDPSSPTGEFGATIAAAADLDLIGDERSAILYYLEPTTAETRFTIDSGVTASFVRPWASSLRYVLIFLWVAGAVLLLASNLQGLRAVVFPLLIPAPFLALILVVGLVGGTGELVGGVRIDEHGVSLPGIFRRRHISWSQVDLIHSVDSDDLFVSRLIRVVCKTESDTNLPTLTKRQVDVVAEALVRFGRNHGLNSNVFVGDFGRHRPAGSLTKSPINDGSRI